MKFDSCFEEHDHLLILCNTEPTENMKNDLKMFNKNSKVIYIKDSLEKKYSVQINYHIVYREFRRLYPRFGDEDAKNLISIFEQKDIYYKLSTDNSNTSIERMFFATKSMAQNYELYEDIVLIDSTYRINHYNMPLIVYSGIDSGGRNMKNWREVNY